MKQYKTGDFGVPVDNFEGVMIGTLLKQMKHKKDAYDGDETTVSPYDAEEQYKKWDFGVAAGSPGSKSPLSRAAKKDEHDGD